MSYRLEFTIPLAPSMNTADNTNRWVRHREKKTIHGLVKMLTIGLRPRRPLQFAAVRIIRRTAAHRAPDFENLTQGGKHILDGLVKCGVLADDNQGVIGQPHYDWEPASRGNAHTVVIVEGP